MVDLPEFVCTVYDFFMIFFFFLKINALDKKFRKLYNVIDFTDFGKVVLEYRVRINETKKKPIIIAVFGTMPNIKWNIEIGVFVYITDWN